MCTWRRHCCFVLWATRLERRRSQRRVEENTRKTIVAKRHASARPLSATACHEADDGCVLSTVAGALHGAAHPQHHPHSFSILARGHVSALEVAWELLNQDFDGMDQAMEGWWTCQTQRGNSCTHRPGCDGTIKDGENGSARQRELENLMITTASLQCQGCMQRSMGLTNSAQQQSSPSMLPWPRPTHAARAFP